MNLKKNSLILKSQIFELCLPVNRKNITFETENWSFIVGLDSFSILESGLWKLSWSLAHSISDTYWVKQNSWAYYTFITKANCGHCDNSEIKTGGICPSLNVAENQNKQNNKKTN